MRYLKIFRLALSILFFIPILLFFVDFTAILPLQLHQLLSIQWIPALLSFNLVALLILLVMSVLVGRFYCSAVCPLGVFQDIVTWKARLFRKKRKYRFQYRKPQQLLRYSVLAVTVLFFVFGSSFFVLLLDPYSNFGRIITQLFRPISIYANNSLATMALKVNVYAFHEVKQAAFVPVAFGISVIYFLLIVIMSWTKGRLYCSTLCPVGTGLGLLSKLSIFNISFDESNCNSCGLCEKRCKSECIDAKQHAVDDTRCVSCFNCISVCKKNAINYSYRYKKKTAESAVEYKVDNTRRTFLLTSGALVATAALAKPKQMIFKNDSILNRKPIMPPGAFDLDHFNSHCTGCQLCVSKCPMRVLKPATLQYGLSGITQPHLVFSTEVFCAFDCNICTTVCPTKALKPLSIEEKKRTVLGIAKFRKELCEVFVHEKDCGACAEHCPVQAVHMIPYKNGLTIPEVTDNLCIGCGACESICPVLPYQAIYIEGSEKQTLAVKPKDAEKFTKKVDDFGF
jgi:ferredoxin